MASLVSLPDTLYHLDYVRPDLLFLRVVARSLILWEEMQPTDIWIENQIPGIIKNLYKDFGTLAELRSGIIDLKKNKSADEFQHPILLNKEEHIFSICSLFASRTTLFWLARVLAWDLDSPVHAICRRLMLYENGSSNSLS